MCVILIQYRFYWTVLVAVVTGSKKGPPFPLVQGLTSLSYYKTYKHYLYVLHSSCNNISLTFKMDMTKCIPWVCFRGSAHIHERYLKTWFVFHYTWQYEEKVHQNQVYDSLLKA